MIDEVFFLLVLAHPYWQLICFAWPSIIIINYMFLKKPCIFITIFDITCFIFREIIIKTRKENECHYIILYKYVTTDDDEFILYKYDDITIRKL